MCILETIIVEPLDSSLTEGTVVTFSEDFSPTQSKVKAIECYLALWHMPILNV